MHCLSYQIHDFSKFEFLNFKKTVNGHINGKFHSIFSKLIVPQEGLSISSLGVEQSTLKVTYIIVTSVLGVEPLRGVILIKFVRKY